MLIQDRNLGAFAVSVPCHHCGRMIGRLADAIIDTDGPPFKAYYHRSCAENVFGPATVETLAPIGGDR